MRRDVQALLAGVRTDLDAFSDCEADALMLSGYLMARNAFSNCIRNFPVSFEPARPWRFTAIEPIASSESETSTVGQLLNALQIAAGIWGKTYRASSALAGTGISSLLLLLAAVAWFTWRHWNTPLSTTLGHLLAWIAVAAASLAVIRLLLTKVLRYRNPYIQVLASIFMCIAGWLILILHLRVAEPRYLQIGPKYRP
jgi:hypothetical protein